MVEFLSDFYYEYARALIILFTFCAFNFRLCYSAKVRNFNIDNTVTPTWSTYNFQHSSLYLPDGKIKGFPFELKPVTAFVELKESNSRKIEKKKEIFQDLVK